jgi:hypothetical protein
LVDNTGGFRQGRGMEGDDVRLREDVVQFDLGDAEFFCLVLAEVGIGRQYGRAEGTVSGDHRPSDMSSAHDANDLIAEQAAGIVVPDFEPVGARLHSVVHLVEVAQVAQGLADDQLGDGIGDDRGGVGDAESALDGGCRNQFVDGAGRVSHEAE